MDMLRNRTLRILLCINLIGTWLVGQICFAENSTNLLQQGQLKINKQLTFPYWYLNSQQFSADITLNSARATPENQFDKLIIVVHGTKRNGKRYLQNLYQAYQGSQSHKKIAMLAPVFLIANDENTEDVIYWDKNDQWKQGDLSSPQLDEQLSSFELLDRLIKHALLKFPSQQIVVVGHSAGAQFVQRYALTSLIEEELMRPLVYLVANPSSYAYLDGRRPSKDGNSSFAVPDNAPANYDQWKYGLQGANSYVTTNARQVNLIKRYAEKTVIYLIGENDNQRDQYLATSAIADLQGQNRLERAQWYYQYLTEFYGSKTHQLMTIPNVGHSSLGVFTSEQGSQLLF